MQKGKHTAPHQGPLQRLTRHRRQATDPPLSLCNTMLPLGRVACCDSLSTASLLRRPLPMHNPPAPFPARARPSLGPDQTMHPPSSEAIPGFIPLTTDGLQTAPYQRDSGTTCQNVFPHVWRGRARPERPTRRPCSHASSTLSCPIPCPALFCSRSRCSRAIHVRR